MKERFIALAHDVGEDRAGRADQRAGDDQRRIAQREADAGRGPSRIGIEHRDHDRHVGAADRDDDQHAEQEGQQRDRPEVRMPSARGRTSRRRTRAASASAMLMTWRAGNRIGLPDMRPESLRKAITEPEKVMAPMAAPSDISIRLAGHGCVRPCRCRRPPARRTPRRRPAPPPCRPANGRRRPAPASPSSGCGARSRRRCRRRWRCRARIIAQVSGVCGPCHGKRGRARQWPCRSCRRSCPGARSPGDDRPRSARMNRTPATR